MKSARQILAALLPLLSFALDAAEPPRIVVDVDKPGHAVPDTLYGIFFEEINHAGEGGLYAEMVLNRDFEMTTLPKGAKWAGNLLRTADVWQERKWFGNELWGWQFLGEGDARGSIRLDSRQPLNERNPHSMRLTVRETGGRAGVANCGFWGMNIVANAWYDLTFHARTEGADRFDVGVSLESANGRERHAAAVMRDVGGGWKKYRVSLQAEHSDRCGQLAMTLNRPGSIWFDVVSLFPRDTFNGRPNGLRPDLVQALADLKPSFVRFPGGAIVGGLNLDNRIHWKNSIGPIAQRQGTMNLWGYWTSNGLGYHEYLQLCEDLGADALWVCNPGFSDNYRHVEYAPPEQVRDFVQEALDAIEYALGPVDSEWGAKRAANGHPEPFPLRHIEIGNEASGEVYGINYRQFYEAIRAKYPALAIISNQRIKDGPPVEIVDDHKYGTPESFFKDHDKYDTADRKGPKVYVGEYGCRDGVGEGNLLGALSEAAYLLGLERNSDVVVMSSYAPLFYHVNDIAWPVNLIGFDNARVVRRSSYHVQQMLAANRPDVVLPTRVEPVAAPKDSEMFALAGLDHPSGEIILKVVNRATAPRAVTIHLNGGASAGKARLFILHHDDPAAENSLDDPEVVVPRESTRDIPGAEFTHTLPANSLTVMRLAPQAPTE